MSRRKARAAAVLAAFDRQASSPELEANPCMLDTFMHKVAGTVIDRFLVPARWKPAPMRRVELIIDLAPNADLADMVKAAGHECAWVEHFEKELAWEREKGTPYPHAFTYGQTEASREVVHDRSE